MVKTENVMIHETEYIRSWSDLGMMIQRDGALYEEAIDPAELGRIYRETDIAIADDTEADMKDYLSALSEFGVRL